MPTYFSLIFEVNKSDHAIGDFCTVLLGSGLSFKGGFWGFENESYEEIINYNQGKLDKDWVLGYTEHHSKNYRQMMFDFFDFSEVRLYIINSKNYPTFNFHLIIPENELADFVKKGKKFMSVCRKDKMDLLKSLAVKVWQRADVIAIQTAWELSAYPPRAELLEKGEKPQAEPFCIVKNSDFINNLGVPCENIGRGGVMIENEENCQSTAHI